MNIIFVVNHLRDWPVQIPGVEIVPARNYLMDAAYCDSKGTKVFNLCKSYLYQRRGYYVSLLAEARGHQPLPDVKAIEDIQSDNVVQLLAESLSELMQSSFAHIDEYFFELNIYFGRDAERRYEQVSEQLFNLLRIPLLHTRFERTAGRWHLCSIRALSTSDVPARDIPVMTQAAADCLQGHKLRAREPAAKKPTLAILHSSDGSESPSNAAALQKFHEAAETLGMRTEVITKNDCERLTQFDALFIRDTTNVNHYTYQFSRQAAVAGMIVMDDPDSILKCTNKVFLTELLARHHIPMPKTLMVNRDNVAQIVPGVVKVHSKEELEVKVHELLEQSELILAQEYLPTEFDWRIGILDRKPLFACKYFMVPGHWQIIKHEDNASASEGLTEAVALDQAPDEVVKIALQAANLIGDGFYGVDLKQRGQHCYVIEINDNPSVDAGNEDGVLQDSLYREVMNIFRKRIEARKGSIVL
jgi:glutathione synthase/RimK-type ligase-like ATP-grasp enzyme